MRGDRKAVCRRDRVGNAAEDQRGEKDTGEVEVLQEGWDLFDDAAAESDDVRDSLCFYCND